MDGGSLWGVTRWARSGWTRKRLWSLVVSLFVVLGPLWLGPAMAPINAALGAHDHVCACGMQAGTCGCPECAEMERERRAEHEATAVPVLKGSCSDDDGAAPGSPLPPCVLPATFVAALIPDVAHLAPRSALPGVSVETTEPPTPPPRAA